MNRADLYENRSRQLRAAAFLSLITAAIAIWAVIWSAIDKNAPLAIGSAVIIVLMFAVSQEITRRAVYWRHMAAEERRFEAIELLSSARFETEVNP